MNDGDDTIWSVNEAGTTMVPKVVKTSFDEIIYNVCVLITTVTWLVGILDGKITDAGGGVNKVGTYVNEIVVGNTEAGYTLGDTHELVAIPTQLLEAITLTAELGTEAGTDDHSITT